MYSDLLLASGDLQDRPPLRLHLDDAEERDLCVVERNSKRPPPSRYSLAFQRTNRSPTIRRERSTSSFDGETISRDAPTQTMDAERKHPADLKCC